MLYGIASAQEARLLKSDAVTVSAGGNDYFLKFRYTGRDGKAQELKWRKIFSKQIGATVSVFTKDGNGSMRAAVTREDGRKGRVRVWLENDWVAGVEMTVEGGDADWEAVFDAAAGERYYGFGEKFNTLDHRGQRIEMLNRDAIGDKGNNCYKCVAFFTSDRGYGLWLDNYSVATFDMAASDSGRYRISVSDIEARFYIIAGPTPKEILTRYTEMSGRPELPPKWAFAPWKSRNVHESRAQFEEDVVRARELDIPGSVIVIDSPWETGYNNYKFNKIQFPKTAQMLKLAYDYGYRVILWHTPFINIENNVDQIGIEPGKSSNYDEAARNGYLIKNKNGDPIIVEWWKGKGALIDLTNPKAVEWWYGEMDKVMMPAIGGFKCDDGEGQYVKGIKYFDPAAWPGRMKNYYSYLYNKTIYEYVKDRTKGDGIIFARSGSAGVQKFPFVWAGDNHADFGQENGLKSVVTAGQTIAMSGFAFWGHDIAGYVGGQTPELFARWAEVGALSPVMQIHMVSNLGAWSFGDEVLDIYRKYAKLHTSLFPYIYRYAYEATRTGLPIIRPLPLVYPDDPESHVQRYEYLFGEEILVAPVVDQGAITREVYFPAGADWVCLHSGVRYAGGRAAEVAALPTISSTL